MNMGESNHKGAVLERDCGAFCEVYILDDILNKYDRYALHYQYVRRNCVCNMKIRKK